VLGKDIFGQEQYRIYEGKPVIVGLNERSLQSIATQLGGEYIYINSPDQLKKYI
jgi:hypothetical protein